MMRRLLICAAVIFFTSATSAADPEEAVARLQLEHRVALFEAREKLAAAFDDVAVLAVKKDDSAAGLAFLEGRRKFLTENLLPGDAALSAAVIEYAEARRTADATLTSRGKKIVEETSAGDAKLAGELKQQLEAYVKGHANQMAVAQARMQQASSVQARATRICDSLSKIISAYDEVVERLSKVKSSLHKPNVDAALNEEAAKILKGQTWTLTCRIVSIHERPGTKGRYELKIEPPLEIAPVAGEWRTTDHWNVALQREQAEKVQAGDWLEITATPVFTRSGSGILNRGFQSKLDSYSTGFINMHNERTNVRHQKSPSPTLRSRP